MKKRSLRTKAEYDRALRKYCFPAWGNRPYGDIITDDITALTHAVVESTPVMGNRLHAYLSKMFRWARSIPMRDGKKTAISKATQLASQSGLRTGYPGTAC